MTPSDHHSHAKPVQEPHPDQVSLLKTLEIAAREMCLGVAQLNDYMKRVDTPPERRPLRLTPQQSATSFSAGAVARSIAVRNNGPVPVYVGVGGETPRANTGALLVAAGGLVVIPALVQDLAVGVDPADVAAIPAGGFVVDMYRFWTVQPIFQSGASGGTNGGTP